MSTADVLVEDIRRALRSAADPLLAPGQQQYMKSAMPYLGVRVPAVRRITRSAARDITDAILLRAAATKLWDAATHREHRYASQALLALKPVAGQPDTFPLVEHIIRTGQWWDHVDEAAHRLGEFLDADAMINGVAAADVLRRWSVDGDFWIRRAAIIAQLGRGARTDLDLLADVIEPNRADREFFIRKGIGWALRDAARAHAPWVRTYVDTHPLSPLSRREALKHLGPH